MYMKKTHFTNKSSVAVLPGYMRRMFFFTQLNEWSGRLRTLLNEPLPVTFFISPSNTTSWKIVYLNTNLLLYMFFLFNQLKWDANSDRQSKRRQRWNNTSHLPTFGSYKSIKQSPQLVGGRHSSVDLSAPTILQPWVWIPCTLSMLSFFQFKFEL